MLLTFLAFACAAGCATQAYVTEDWKGAELSGRLFDDGGRPVEGAFVFAYARGRSVLGPADAMSEPSDRDGKYSLLAPSGRYSIIARRRGTATVGGPMREGDLVGRLPEEDLSLDARTPTTRDIALGAFMQGQEGDPRRILRTATRVRGTVVGEDGRAVEAAHVFAYEEGPRSSSPDFLSPPTGPDGGFVLSLPGAGGYVVGARTGQRGKPRPQDLVGYWGSRETVHAISDGTITEGVVITVRPGAHGAAAPPRRSATGGSIEP